MKIEYFGHSCFRVTNGKGISVLTDPYTRVGYELPKGLRADIVTVSHGHFDHNAVGLVHAENVIDGAGRYAFNGGFVETIDSFHDEKQGALRGKNLIFKWETDGLCVCHLGDLGEPCNDELIEKIGAVDILLIPVGGKYTIDAKTAKEFVEKISPKVVIPMHYKPCDGTIDITDAEEFLGFYEGVFCVGDSPVSLSAQDIKDKKKTIIFMERKR